MDGHIVFLITTYNRVESLQRLVRALAPVGDIYILDDGTEEELNITGDYLAGHQIYIAKQEHRGKKNYWKTINELWLMIYPKHYNYYFMVPDDFLPVERFHEKTIQIWEKIRDPKKICINTYVSQGRLGKKNWTNFTPVEYKQYRKTQWVDMCFMCTKEFFNVVGWIPRINLDWRHHPERSSGVGSHISRKLVSMRYSIYQMKTSMFIPQESAYESQMNPWRDPSDPLNKPVL